jgi:hypothetical protein
VRTCAAVLCCAVLDRCAGHDHAYARTCPFAKGRCTSSPQPGMQHQRASASSTIGGDGRVTRESTTVAAGGANSKPVVVETVTDPTAPIYILAGHAGAGFTHAFPDPLPDWVVFGAQDRNGYLRVTVCGNTLTAVSVSTDDGRVMDGVKVVRTKPRT